MLTKPVVLLRTEGALIFAISVLCYREMHFSWLLFAVLLLVPDLSMARSKIVASGITIEEESEAEGLKRFFIRDPAGNRIEIGRR